MDNWWAVQQKAFFWNVKNEDERVLVLAYPVKSAEYMP